jgi:BirA family biotin operon repressor/biotin-[acetyl-CoA-carboxylase] ligase
MPGTQAQLSKPIATHRKLIVFNLARIESVGLVRTIDYHPVLGSTSDRALELAARGDLALPLLVIADEQTAGRGRGANRWLAKAGALTFSLALAAPLALPQARWPEVALLAGLAVCRALRQFAPSADVRVKWPNDVYLNGKKVCGILSESVSGWRDRLVVGVGVNVNNRLEGSGLEVQGSEQSARGLHQPSGSEAALATATSLIDHDGLPRDLTDVLIAILDEFDYAWQRLTGPDHATLFEEYRAHCFLTGKTVTVGQAADQSTIGLCLGIDAAGRLRLQTASGLVVITSGTILSWDA